jgi:enoyl-CoA hydratase/carnithine racemase
VYDPGYVKSEEEKRMGEGSISVERAGAVTVLTLERPDKANAVTQAMANQLHEACREADAEPDVRAVVVRGAGRHFSAGSDLGSLDEFPTPWEYRNRVDYCDAVLALRKPSVALVSGAAFGGGLELAVSCDIRVADTTARFAAPEVKLGWVGGGGASQLLPRLCGYGNAALLLLTGDPVDADEALRMGLVQAVVEPDRLEETGLAIAGAIAANAPIATQAARAALWRSLSLGVEAGMDYENELITVCLGTDDSREGIAAFFERREPAFQGR